MVKSPLTNVLLVAYGVGFALERVLVRQSRIKGGNEFLAVQSFLLLYRQ